MKSMKADKKTLAAIVIPALAFAALTLLAVAIFRGIAERDRLESHNDSERTMNVLLSRLRDYDDFGAAIESDESLSSKVLGIGAFSRGGESIYSWGSSPAAFRPPSGAGDIAGDSVRLYLDNPENDSVILVFKAFGGPPPDKPPKEAESDDAAPRPGAPKFFFTTLRKADFFYLEIKEPSYWMRRRFEAVLFPLVELALAALVIFVRSLLLRNAEYRQRIEEQKNLVVLGTAASTLAHEIKNPLLSIRLQARILERTCPESAMREIGIINDEVERLSALSHRVGDYLRDPAGNPRPVDPREIAREVGLRLCGRDILASGGGEPLLALMDPERLRSVLENLVRNALEAGAPGDGAERPDAAGGTEAGIAMSGDISIEVGASEAGAVLIDVLDRGPGMSAEAAARIFDPFFTTKSRGTGIGLAVCRRFAAAAGGSVTLSARPGGGCAARLILPAAGSAS